MFTHGLRQQTESLKSYPEKKTTQYDVYTLLPLMAFDVFIGNMTVLMQT